jgi:hypothetical protein
VLIVGAVSAAVYLYHKQIVDFLHPIADKLFEYVMNCVLIPKSVYHLSVMTLIKLPG